MHSATKDFSRTRKFARLASVLLSGALLLVAELAKRRARWSAEAAGEGDAPGGS